MSWPIARGLSGVTLAACLGSWDLGCDVYEYPLPPRFCDDWCRATMRADCEGDWPDACVQECSKRQVPADCSPVQQQLLDCYAAADASEFTCQAMGDEEQRSTPSEGLCQAEITRLDDCQNHDVNACMATCGDLVQQAQDEFERAPSDPDEVWSCGPLDHDCECACYSLFFGGIQFEQSFFDCLGSAIEPACAQRPEAPPPETAGDSCDPAGIFEACIVQATSD